MRVTITERSDKRFTITFSGEHDATIRELFPDDEVVDMQALFGVEQPSFNVFLSEWNYGEKVCITVTDNETGEAWTKPARPLANWEQLYTAIGEPPCDECALLGYRICNCDN